MPPSPIFAWIWYPAIAGAASGPAAGCISTTLSSPEAKGLSKGDRPPDSRRKSLFRKRTRESYLVFGTNHFSMRDETGCSVKVDELLDYSSQFRSCHRCRTRKMEKRDRS